MAKRQNFLIALFSVLLVLALGYIAVYALYLYELTQRTFVLTYNLLEYLVAVPLAFFSAAALLCLVLRAFLPPLGWLPLSLIAALGFFVPVVYAAKKYE